MQTLLQDRPTPADLLETPLNDLSEEPTVSILVVDDDDVDRQRLRRLTANLDLPVEVIEASDIAGMRDCLDGKSFDVILIDYRLTLGDGIEALKLVRDHPENRSAATIMVAGDAQLDVAVSAFKSGCDDFVAKMDLDAASLRNAVFEALSKTARAAMAEHDIDLARLTDRVMAGVSKASFQKMRPILSRMLRQIRSLAPQRAALSSDQSRAFDGLEAACMSLWEYLNEIDADRRPARCPI